MLFGNTIHLKVQPNSSWISRKSLRFGKKKTAHSEREYIQRRTQDYPQNIEAEVTNERKELEAYIIEYLR
jgi:hypothetical protein